MAGTIDSLRTINSLIRTLLAAIAIGGLAIASWKGYSVYYAHEIESARQQRELDSMQEQ